MGLGLGVRVGARVRARVILPRSKTLLLLLLPLLPPPLLCVATFSMLSLITALVACSFSCTWHSPGSGSAQAQARAQAVRVASRRALHLAEVVVALGAALGRGAQVSEDELEVLEAARAARAWRTRWGARCSGQGLAGSGSGSPANCVRQLCCISARKAKALGGGTPRSMQRKISRPSVRKWNEKPFS